LFSIKLKFCVKVIFRCSCFAARLRVRLQDPAKFLTFKSVSVLNSNELVQGSICGDF